MNPFANFATSPKPQPQHTHTEGLWWPAIDDPTSWPTEVATTLVVSNPEPESETDRIWKTVVDAARGS